MAETFSCPSCGAPLTVRDSDGATIICPYCRNSVIVPPELQQGHRRRVVPHDQLDEQLIPQIRDFLARNQKIEAIKLVRQHTSLGLKEAKDAVDAIQAGQGSRPAGPSTSGPGQPDPVIYVAAESSPARRAYPALIAAAVGVVIFMAGLAAMLIFIQPSPPPAPPPVLPTRLPSASPAPTRTATPQFASLAATIGTEGIGAWMFTQANSLAFDPDGYLYVGDYKGNRVQVFDPSGKYIRQWIVDPSRHIRRLAAGLNGELYANLSGRVFRYDRQTGQPTGEVQYKDATDGDIDDFDNMAVALDGSLLVTWINHTLETSAILRFDPSGKLLQTILRPVQEQTGEFDPLIYLAVDGLGNIYALGEYSRTLCEYSAQGTLIRRFGSEGDKPGQFRYPENLAIDSHGRIYVSESGKVQVFDANGLYLDTFETDRGGFVMVFDRQDNLYLLENKQVTKYVLR